MADGLNQILADPKFQALSPDAKRVVVGKFDQRFASLSPEAQTIALGKLTTTPQLPSPSPAGLANQALAGTGIQVAPLQSGVRLPEPPPIGALGSAALAVDPTLRRAGGTAAGIVGSMAEGLRDPVASSAGMAAAIGADPYSALNINKQELERAARERDIPSLVAEAGVPIATAIAAGRLGGKATKGVPRPEPFASVRPKIVQIEGVDMPVLVGEAAETPSTLGQRAQIALKRAGAAPDEFTKVEAQQQNAVKQVIRNVTQRTSGLTGPLPESPVGAVAQGSEAVFEQARPMYQALDASLTHVPTVLDQLGTLTQKAIGRLRNKGIEIGNTYNPEQPLQSMQAIRSELLEMQRAARRTGDTLKAKIAGDEAMAIDGDISETLQNARIRGLYDNWRQANALWKRGVALRDVADVIDGAVKGTPVEAQVNIPGQIETRPVEINAASLVERLNDLSRDGTLDKAFGQGYARSIRQVAEFLKRAQETNIGTRTARVGGYSPRSAGGHLVTDFMFRVGGGTIAKLMTDIKGAKLVANLTGAETPTQVASNVIAINKRLALPSGQYEAGPPTPGSQPQLSGFTDPFAKVKADYAHAILSEYTDEGFRAQFGIAPSMRISDLVKSGLAEKTPSGMYRIKLTPEQAKQAATIVQASMRQPQAPTGFKQLPEGVLEGEYVSTPAPKAPRVAQPAPPPETFHMPPPSRPALPSGQKALPPARSIQLANVSDSTAKLISKTRGFTNVEDVMMAAKEGTITPAEAARITQLLKGKAASITRRIQQPEAPPTGPQGGHAGGGVASAEELSRPGTNYIISKSGSITYHGKAFAPETIRAGATHVTVLADGNIRVNAGTLTEAQRSALSRALKR